MIMKKLMQLVPMAGRFLKGRPTIQKALTPLMIIHTMSPIETQSRSLATKSLTKNIELMTSSREIKVMQGNSLQLQLDRKEQQYEAKPLSILLCWMMSQRKHVMKYAQFYLDQGFDVLTVKITPWQLLWPVTGSQIIAKDVASFMSLNTQYNTTILHGFSVGGYLWGECLNIFSKDPVKYQRVVDGIVGQIWDSVVDFVGIPTGLPKAIFPNKNVLRTSLEKYVRYHMDKFYETATKHYYNSSANYHNSIVRAPALFLCSLDDPIGTIEGIQKVQNNWEANLNMKVYLKAWKSSPHVSHLHHHPEDYKQEMKAFLEKLDLVPYPERFLLKARA